MAYTKAEDDNVDTKQELVNKEIILNTNDFNQVVSVITDYPQYTKIFGHMINSKILYFTREGVVCHFEFEVMGRNFWAKVELIEVHINKDKVVVQEKTLDTNLKELSGRFVIERLDDNQVKVKLYGTARPRLPIPTSWVKSLLDDELSSTFRKLKKIIEG